MEAIGVLLGLYISLTLLLIVWGFGHLIYNNIKHLPTQKPVRILLTGVIMFVIGFGGCTLYILGIS